MAVVIRPCRPDEDPALLDLWHHADASPSPTDTPEQVDQVIQNPAASVLVAVDHDLLVGSIIGGWDGWRGNIYRLAVLPSYRRRGARGASPRSWSTITPARSASGTRSTRPTPA
jgi:ribosomal protein S18 acetylase RimI-like enzyme